MKVSEGLYWYSKDKPFTQLLGRGFSCNAFAIDQGNEIWLVDTGVSQIRRVAYLLKQMRADGLDPTKMTKIFVTHAHPDHMNAAAQLKAQYGCQIVIHEKEVDRMAGGDKFFWEDQWREARGLNQEFYPAPIWLVKFFVRYAMGPMPDLKPDRIVKDGDTFSGQNFDLQVIHTPGHTSGHCCFWLPRLGAMFIGDLIDPSFDHKASLNFCTSDYNEIYHSITRLVPMGVKIFCAAHAKKIYFGEEVCRELFDGTLAKLDTAVQITTELLQQAGKEGMQLKDFYGKYPKKTWMLQDQLCVPYTIFKKFEAEGKARFEGGRFYWNS